MQLAPSRRSSLAVHARSEKALCSELCALISLCALRLPSRGALSPCLGVGFGCRVRLGLACPTLAFGLVLVDGLRLLGCRPLPLLTGLAIIGP